MKQDKEQAENKRKYRILKIQRRCHPVQKIQLRYRQSTSIVVWGQLGSDTSTWGKRVK